MAPLADFIVNYVPLPSLPHYLTHYVPGETPLSTAKEVFPTLAAYLAIVFGIREVMKDRAPLKLQHLFQIHNTFLYIGSGLLVALIAEEVIPGLWNHGFYWAICADEQWTSRLEFYYMINYYFKYIELIDTVFLALKKKPLAFLHVYHHSATALLCFVQLNGKPSVQWVPISINLCVHVLMYYYYYATAGGAKIWWKKYLTTMQIAQFVIDLFVVYFATYSFYATARLHWLPSFGSCSGTELSALFGCALLSSYLVLFIEFYMRTYKQPVKGKKVAGGKGNGVANGHKVE